MPNYRRHYIPGGSYFFSIVSEHRANILGSELARSCLRNAIKECQVKWAFETVAFVLLEDHLHTLWTLPKGDDVYSLQSCQAQTRNLPKRLSLFNLSKLCQVIPNLIKSLFFVGWAPTHSLKLRTAHHNGEIRKKRRF
jgi:REP element-mobilizing transposase RayT